MLTDIEQQCIIKEYINGEGTTSLGKKYNVVPMTIYKIVKKSGVKLRPKPDLNLDEQTISKMLNLYKSKISSRNIAKQFGVSQSYVLRIIKKHNIPILNKTDYKYKCDDSFFSNINNEKKAYWLGFLFADGCVTSGKRNTLHFSLHKNDEYMIRNFVEDIKFEGNILRNKEQRTITIFNKKLCEDLIVLGCTPRKSLTLQFPNINDETLIKHFIRGYFDGDGCLHLNKLNSSGYVQFTSSTNFCKFLQNFILKKFSIKSKMRVISKNHELSSYLRITHQLDMIKFLDWLYVDSHLFLDRKYKKYSLFKKTISGENK